MKNNYPVKYGIMPIKEYNRSMSGYETRANVVSKCYIISTKVDYLENGQKHYEYEVVFPYQRRDTETLKRVDPIYNADGNCINSCVLDSVYDTYEEAEKIRFALNDKIRHELIADIKVKNSLRYIYKNEIDTYFHNIKELEQDILENTNDLLESMEPKDNTVIHDYRGNPKISIMTIYDFMKLFYNEFYAVYNVSTETFALMQEKIKNNQEIDNSIPKECLIVNDKEEGIRLIDDEVELEQINDKYCRVYTTETYDDIINSLSEKPDIAMNRSKKRKVNLKI